jgi:Peptidase S24-like
MQGEVTRRLLYAYQLLKQNGTIKSGRQFALGLDYLPQSWSEVQQGRRDIPLDVLHRAINLYKIDPTFLFSGNGEPFFNEFMNEKVRIRTIVVNELAQENILFVPLSALGTYPSACTSPEYLTELPRFTQPEFKVISGNHRCFYIASDQMEPALYDGDRVMGSFLHPDKWAAGIRDNQVFVVVTKSEVVVRRLLNKLIDQKSIILVCDNNFHPPVRVYEEDILEIWLVIQKTSPFLHAQTYKEDTLKEQIGMLFDQLTEQNKLLQTVMGSDKDK